MRLIKEQIEAFTYTTFQEIRVSHIFIFTKWMLIPLIKSDFYIVT